MPTEKNSVETKIQKWLEKQGYPLEMSVAQAFQQFDFQVAQSSFYIDHETNKPREIDVKTWRVKPMKKMNAELLMSIGCNIECKLALDKPWILFKSTNEVGLELCELVVGSKIGEWLVNGIVEDQIAYGKRLIELDMFPLDRVGHSITQAFTSGQDIPYQAGISAFKSAVWDAVQYDEHNKYNPTSQNAYLSLVFPTVVIDGRLFECYLSDDGSVVINEIESGILAWNTPIANHFRPVIHIYTKSALSQLIQNVNNTIDNLIDICTGSGMLDEIFQVKAKFFNPKAPDEAFL